MPWGTLLLGGGKAITDHYHSRRRIGIQKKAESLRKEEKRRMEKLWHAARVVGHSRFLMDDNSTESSLGDLQ